LEPAGRDEAAFDLLDSWERSVVDTAPEYVEAGLEDLGEGGARPAIAVVPYQNCPLTPQAPAVRRRFETFLETLIAKAFSTDPGPPPAERPEADQGPAMDAACMLCKGKCCISGAENHAHLAPEDVQRYRRRNPDATREKIRDAYLEHLPETSTLTGCVFQAATGCTLPRGLRSDTCNGFVCRGQNRLKEAFAAGATSAVLIAAPFDRAVAVATWTSVSGFRKVPIGRTNE
jgi:hypothetical protein